MTDIKDSGTDADIAGMPTPNPHATAEQVEAAMHDSKLAQVLYHDWEAETYDEKWSISYDQRCIDYARGRFDAIVPEAEQRELPYDRALELGCGTGFFLLNLVQSGVARRGSVTDLSPGMVKVATRNGQSLGLDIDGRVADAEGIPQRWVAMMRRSLATHGPRFSATPSPSRSRNNVMRFALTPSASARCIVACIA